MDSLKALHSLRPGKVDRKKYIRGVVNYFKNTYPHVYQMYAVQNKMTRDTRADKFGTMEKKDADLVDFREGITIPKRLLMMINAKVPDVTKNNEMTPVLNPPFLQSGYAEGTNEYAFAKKELEWFRKEFPDFTTSEKF